MAPDRPLGCSKCRFSTKGCGRCSNPACKPRLPRSAAANAITAQPEQQLATSHNTRTQKAEKRARKQTEGSKDSLGTGTEVKSEIDIHVIAHASTCTRRRARAPRADKAEQQAELRPHQTLLQVHPGTSSPLLLQQQQHKQEVVSSGQCQTHEKRRVCFPSRSSSLAKRLRTALQQTAAPHAAIPAANDDDHAGTVETAVSSAGAGAAAGARAAAPVTAEESPAECVVDGEAHLSHVLQEQLNTPAAAAAAGAAEATMAAFQQHKEPLGATSEAAAIPAATIAAAAAAAAAVSPAAHFTQVLQQRIQAQLAQGRQKLPSKARGSSSSSRGAAGLSQAAPAAGNAAEAATPTKRQQHNSSEAEGAAGAQQQLQQQQHSAPPMSTDSSSGAAAIPHAASPAVINNSPAAPSPNTPRGARSKPRAPGRKPKHSYKPPKPYTHLAVPGEDPRVPVPGWCPPVSPFGLLEEELWQQPWQLLLGCMLLNKTTSKQVRGVFWQLLELCPTPEAAVAADPAAIRAIVTPLGLHNKRALAVQRLSHDFIHKQWSCPTELYGIGKYAADAYYIFCRGQWQGVQPDDKDLIKYHEWLRATGGQGTGFAAAAAMTGPVAQLQQQ